MKYEFQILVYSSFLFNRVTLHGLKKLDISN